MNINAFGLVALSLFGALTCQVTPVSAAPESAPSAVVKATSADSAKALTPGQDQAIVAAAKKQLAAFGGKTPIPGVYIAVYMPNKAPYIKGVGLANTKTKKPFELPDRFRIGSNTKTFVVTVLLQLQDEHLLSVDDPISKFNIGVDIPNGKNITIRQLAEMRSGLFEAYDTKEFNALDFKPNMNISPNKLIGWAVAHKPLFKPGEKWNYSNTNYLILGRIIEVVAHDTVGNQIRKRVIEKFGLTETTFPDTVAMPTPYAHGYGLDKKGNWEDVSETLSPSITWAAGNMISTVPDMQKWVKAYSTGTTNSAASQKDRLRCLPIAPKTKMSFGMGIGHSAGWYGYTGGLPGYQTAAYYLPEKDITLIAFVTAQKETPFPGTANVIAREVSRIVTPKNVMFTDAPTEKPH
ncbi:MAG: beta-lactamase family protein [Cyanobacteria bacterium SZAS-4]|nr:beta-lactamase family protein [Cyanobacteria bacterium SZAS-4]